MVGSHVSWSAEEELEVASFIAAISNSYSSFKHKSLTGKVSPAEKNTKEFIGDILSAYQEDYEENDDRLFKLAASAKSLLLEISLYPDIPKIILKTMIEKWQSSYIENADWLKFQMPQVLSSNSFTQIELKEIYDLIYKTYTTPKSPVGFLVHSIIGNVNCPAEIFYSEMDKLLINQGSNSELNSFWVQALSNPHMPSEMFNQACEYILNADSSLVNFVFVYAVRNENCPEGFFENVEEIIRVHNTREMWIAEAATAKNCPPDVAFRLLDNLPFSYTLNSKEKLESKIDKFLISLGYENEFLAVTPYDLKCRIVLKGQAG